MWILNNICNVYYRLKLPLHNIFKLEVFTRKLCTL